MEPSEDPRTGRAFHAVDLSQKTLDALALMTQEGNEAAGRELWRRSDATARGIARARGLHDEADWRDACTTTFLTCLRKFRPALGHFGPYFAKSVDLALIQASMKRAERHRRSVELDGVDERRLCAEDTDASEQTRDLVMEAAEAAVTEIGRQSTTDRSVDNAAIALMFLLEHLKPAEIAHVLGAKRKDVYNVVHRVVKPTMRQQLGLLRNDGADGVDPSF
jgi:DNA-directed RNA polymerase specialized sigma24 family protein